MEWGGYIWNCTLASPFLANNVGVSEAERPLYFPHNLPIYGKRSLPHDLCFQGSIWEHEELGSIAGHFYVIMMEAPRQERFKIFPPCGFDPKQEQQGWFL